MRLKYGQVQIRGWVFDFVNNICFPTPDTRLRIYKRHDGLFNPVHLRFYRLYYKKGEVFVTFNEEKRLLPPMGIGTPETRKLNDLYVGFLLEKEILTESETKRY